MNVPTISACIFGALALGVAVPPLLTFKPFTFHLSKKNIPDSVVSGTAFLKINQLITGIWALLFLAAAGLSLIPYHSNDWINLAMASVMPVLVLVGIGVPASSKLPAILMERMASERLTFASISDLFAAMPLGLNKANAEDVDCIIQFVLSGGEATTGYLTILDQQCTYTEGMHSAPTTTIHCDSTLWLKISNGEVSGDTALLNKEYEIEGDASVMLTFADLFIPDKKEKSQPQRPIKYEYKSFEPGKIKRITVFDGGFRKPTLSKTSWMVDHFLRGAKEAGAEVETFKLKDMDIKECTGCFNCWTKTPGVCIFEDDMAMLLEKYRDSDLVVFASPLYIFNVTGIFKTFMDRLLPVLQPYMKTNEHGATMHPDRFPAKGEQGFVVFSAAGFPDVEHNFDGLTGMFRAWDGHNENMYLMGEFLLTAAEMISQPVYSGRKKKIEAACYKAGQSVVREGRIDKNYMMTVRDTGVSKESFKLQANAFWKRLDGKNAYMAEVPQLEQHED